ncbi:MAG: hypothetical protein J6V27_05460 [Alistipes sp.]|nr:hypothetical protein [Alistipes sp.]
MFNFWFGVPINGDDMNHTSKKQHLSGVDIGMNTRTIKHTLTDDGWK